MSNSSVSLAQKEELFCQEYIVDFDAKKALTRSGYICHNPLAISRQLMNLPRIQERINELLEVRSKNVGVDALWVLESAVKLYNRCMTYEAVIDKDGVEIGVFKFDSRGANAALNTIGKHVGVQAFKKIVEHTGRDGGPMVLWGANPLPVKEKQDDQVVEPSPLIEISPTPPVISFMYPEQ